MGVGAGGRGPRDWKDLIGILACWTALALLALVFVAGVWGGAALR